jgi:hypothetical protein
MSIARARASASLLLAAALLLACRTARADVGDESLGINAHIPSEDQLDMAVDLGVPWIRVDANWRELHTGPGAFSWGEMDRVVDQASARGLRIYMTLAYTPDWVPRVSRTRTDTYGGNDEPATSSEWTAFVRAIVARYSARGVTHFGIWNEPNLDSFWESAAGVGPYVDKILVPGADAVRASCPTCLVLGPDLAHVGDYDVFLGPVLDRAGDRFDILAHHIYQGWPETGVSVWDGDRFLESLEMRRFPFTRASLREVLDAHGWAGEVWITETGYRTQPVGDAAEETDQDTYVRRVMEEQLARSWWTNTFFYELVDCGIDLPGCTIDGFGITRPTRGAPRSFPADYRRKPAYYRIQGFIDAHPEITSSAPPPACANGRDDDADGRVDSEDRGCSGGTDDDESDDPSRTFLEALPAPAGGITVDGSLAEWDAGGELALSSAHWVGVIAYGGETDLSATVRARWASGSLYLGVEVRDDTHIATGPDDQLYLGDSLQLAFDVESDRTFGAYDADDHELNFARVGATTRSFRFHGAGDAAWTASVVRAGTSTTYEVRLPASVLGGVPLVRGTALGFSMLVNDDDGFATPDGTGRDGWVELTPGIGRGKNPYAFADLALNETSMPRPDAGPGTDASMPLPDAAVVPIDASAPAGEDAYTAGEDASTGSLDAGGGLDAGVRRRTTSSDCGCRAGSREGPGRLGWILVAGGLALAASRARRSRRGPR